MPIILTFFYTHYPNYCPLIAQKIHTTLYLLGKQAGLVAILGISVDPEHDTKAGAQRFSAMAGTEQPRQGRVPCQQRGNDREPAANGKERETPPANSPIVRNRKPRNRNPSVPRRATFVLNELRNSTAEKMVQHRKNRPSAGWTEKVRLRRSSIPNPGMKITPKAARNPP
jgi:hypothetical protein